MPIVFEEVDTEITPERGAGAEREGEAHVAPSEGGAQLDQLRRALDVIAERRSRLVAD